MKSYCYSEIQRIFLRSKAWHRQVSEVSSGNPVLAICRRPAMRTCVPVDNNYKVRKWDRPDLWNRFSPPIMRDRYTQDDHPVSVTARLAPKGGANLGHPAIVRGPFRLNLNHPYFAQGVMAKAAPLPLCCSFARQVCLESGWSEDISGPTPYLSG